MYFKVTFESQIVNLTLNIESIWLKYSPITRNPGSNFDYAMQWLNFLGQNDSIFSFSASTESFFITRWNEENMK